MNVASPMRQIPLAIGPAPEASFESFVVGDNALAVDCLRAPGAAAYLWGDTGAGKTHLLAALAHEARARGAGCGWFDAATPLPWTFDAGWAAVLFDDCQDWDDARQRAGFALHIEAQSHGVPVVAAGRAPPVDLPLREDLRTRLGWGAVFEIRPLAEAQARAVLRREADRRGIFLSDEVMAFLLTRFARDLKHLMALLDRLDVFALAEHRAVTVPLLKRMFDEDVASS